MLARGGSSAFAGTASWATAGRSAALQSICPDAGQKQWQADWAEALCTCLQVGAALQILYPLVCLALRVDHEGPPPGVSHHNSIVNGQRIVGQPSNEPLPDLDWDTQHSREGKCGAVRDA